MGSDGNLISVGALLRIEGDVANSRYRITVRAKNPIVVKGLRNTIKSFLAANS